MARQAEIKKNEVRFREFMLDEAEIAVVAFGTAGRIAQSAVKVARDEDIRVGLFRPVSLFPFPYERIRELAEEVKTVLVVEMNGGQMVDDVRMGLEGTTPVHFYGKMGGVMPMPDEILEEIRKVHATIETVG
jgi:2-oxoglutarate ferredoxin oxidoreductase subunit alpha